MNKFLKQLFCKHIYKCMYIATLYWRREFTGSAWHGLPTYSNFIYSARTEICLKCGKEVIIEHRQNIEHQIPEGVIEK